MRAINKNVQVISALICAILMISCSLILNKPEDSNVLFMMLGAIAAIHVVMSLFLVNKNSQKRKQA